MATFLDDDRIGRVVLVEVTYHDGVDERKYYFSNKPFVTGPSDTPANTAYDDLLDSVPTIQSSVDRGFSVGNVRFKNTESRFDEWWEYSFQGWPIKIMIGPEGGTIGQFITLVDGVNDGITFPSKDVGQIAFRNKALVLDTEIQLQSIGERIEALYPPAENPTVILLPEVRDEPCPVSFGKVFNVPAIRATTGNIFIVHDGPCVVTEVRDNGASVNYTDNGDGTFVLSQAQVGTITADVEEGTTFSTKEIVQEVVLRADPTIVFDDSFDTYPEYEVGIFVGNGGTHRQVVDEIVEATSGFWYFNRTGEMVIGVVQDPENIDPEDLRLFIDVDDIEFNGISITQYEAPKKRIRLGYQKNYTVQPPDSIAGVVQAEQFELVARFGQEFNEVFSDNNIEFQWPFAESTDLIGTLLYNEADAQLEADRLALLQSKPRIQIRLKCFARPLQLELGDFVNITHPKWNLSMGRNAVVVGLNENPTLNRVEIEVWL